MLAEAFFPSAKKEFAGSQGTSKRSVEQIMENEEIKQLHQRIRELEELNQLAQKLSSTLDVEKTLAAIIACSMSLCNAERGAIALFYPKHDNDVDTIIRNSALSQNAIDHTLNMLVAGYLQHTKQSFVTPDILQSFQYSKPTEKLLEHGAALAVPLRSEGAVFGMIHHVNRRGGEQFSPDAIRVAEIIANMASQFITRAKLHETLHEEFQQVKSALAKQQRIRPILGNSTAIQKLLKDISLVAPTSASILISGETGTGKELAALAIHAQSTRSAKPFIAINCAAIPADLFESELLGHERGAFTGASTALKGKFELADGGTLFLDEISEMPIALQPKLLRVLEDRKFCRVGSSVEIQVDVRVLAASSKDLEKSMEQEKFSEALYHRLNVVPIFIPPLRDRREDIPLLAQAMIAEVSGGANKFQHDALNLLTSMEWRGNVRELRNIVERISILSQNREITAEDVRSLGLGSQLNGFSSMAPLLRKMLAASESDENLPERLEKELITIALKESSGNVSHAARLIGMDRMALQRRIEKFGLL